MKHYKFGGSTAARTIGCPAWVSLSEAMPKQIASSYADVGTMLHDCMEKMLLDTYQRPEDFLGFKHEDQTVSQEMVDDKLQPALDAFHQLCKEYDLTEYEAETTMQASDEIGGTADFIAAGDDVVCIGDWKFGDGIQVSPVESAQGLLYAMLAKKEIPDFFNGKNRLLIAIIQPSIRGEETLRTWETTMDALDDFELKFLRAVNKAKNQDSEPTPGSHCQWCPAAPTCPAKTGLILQARRLNPTQIATVSEALDVAKELSDWIKDVNAFAHQQMEMGVKFDNWKLVQKRATNKWHDADSALNVLRNAKGLKLEEGAPPALISAPQMIALCKKKGVDFDKFAAYCSATSSGTTIAPSTDKRPEYLPMAIGEELAKILN
jgi:hypothetical protein